jgi:hypothetical protein
MILEYLYHLISYKQVCSYELSTNKYQVIKNAISYELANFCFNYFLLKRDAVNYMYNTNMIAENGMFGTWTDQQVPGVYSIYADHVMETLLVKTLPVMKERTGLDLIPTYSYARVYEKGSILKRHKDRPSCEISTTVNLGGDFGQYTLILQEAIMLLMNIKIYINLMHLQE